MKSKHNTPEKYYTIAALHEAMGLPKPLHPLISVIDNEEIPPERINFNSAFLFDFYKISFKKTLKGIIGYGQSNFDFDEGGLVFTAPNQLITLVSDDMSIYGKSIFIHADFLRNYPLGTTIKSYGFFSYEASEALHLSDKERTKILVILSDIEEELNGAIDDFSQDVMISYVEVLLNYSKRFYKRQFITRKPANHNLLMKLEQYLDAYFDNEDSLSKGLPSVEMLANELHLSPRYLSDMLRSLTGQNAQQHIHEKVIEKAKQYLTSTQLSISEIAYQLGYEYSQSFSKLFKKKTNQTPVEYKQSLN
ncbi:MULTISPECIES: helix-turn-helix domain-containing protein [Sphingobacterium]|uniref:helix-turn-helix domain-containing protein n=1 Tax=Sphingobacterium TaxID=28453 RepID=UPI00104658C5|nr:MULTISPECIES: response regulator transcription factor [Sphingobacterium]MCW2259807.1 AraC-like DNA-binding protein [Sphingobacterium kitahiroshimense]TCR03353.1 AraC-like DNA-binding protein [Sphingobacterium sp. JUb78]